MSAVTPEFIEILKEIKDILELNLNDIDLENEDQKDLISFKLLPTFDSKTFLK